MSFSVSHTGPVEDCLAKVDAAILGSVAHAAPKVIQSARRCATAVAEFVSAAAHHLTGDSDGRWATPSLRCCPGAAAPELTVAVAGHFDDLGFSLYSLSVAAPAVAKKSLLTADPTAPVDKVVAGAPWLDLNPAARAVQREMKQEMDRFMRHAQEHEAKRTVEG